MDKIWPFGVMAILVLAAGCGGGGGSGTNGPPTPSQITITGGNNQRAPVGTILPAALSVHVTGLSGQSLSGASVTWAVTAGGGSLTSISTSTDSNGVATTQWKLGTTAGANTATATIASLPPASFSANGSPGPLASMILTNPKNPLASGDTVTIGVTAADQYGNDITNISPTWTATESGVATISATGSLTATGAGAAFITATSGAVDTTLPIVVNGNVTFTLGAEEVVFTYTKDACEASDIPDGPAKAVRLADSSLTLISSNAPRNYALFGADFSSLKRSCAPTLTSPVSSSASTFANEEWAWSPYRIGNTIHLLIHNEYHDPISANCSPGNPLPGNPCWYNSILYASSSDGGHTYTQAASPAQVVAPPATQWNPGPPTPALYGYLNPSNIVQATDGYYYSMFISFESVPSSGTSGMCIMRTQTLGDPTSWRAWDGSGFNLQMTDPYAGPAPPWCTPVIPNVEIVGSLTYNTYLAAYMFVGDVAVAAACGTAFFTSTDLVHWSSLSWLRAIYSPFTGGGSTACAPPRGVASVAYSSIIDHSDSTINFEKPGQTPYLYYTRFNPTGGSLNRDLVRVPVMITAH